MSVLLVAYLLHHDSLIVYIEMVSRKGGDSLWSCGELTCV